jgi:hypothetical protein
MITKTAASLIIRWPVIFKLNSLLGVFCLIISGLVISAVLPIPLQARESLESCTFENFTVPDDAVIWVGMAPSDGRPLGSIEPPEAPIKGAGMGHVIPTQIDVVVNQPDKPVILFLSSSWSLVWNFRWTPGTKIAAVMISGEYPQRAVGLPKGTPLLIRGAKLQCRQLKFVCDNDTDKLMIMNSISSQMLGRKPDQAFRAHWWYLLLGEKDYDRENLLSADDRLAKEAIDYPQPERGEGWTQRPGFEKEIEPQDSIHRMFWMTPRLQSALDKKLLKVVSPELMRTWMRNNIQRNDVENLANESTRYPKYSSTTLAGYEIISSEFRLTDVCPSKGPGIQIFIPENIHQAPDFFPPDGDFHGCTVFFVKDGSSVGSLRYKILWDLKTNGKKPFLLFGDRFLTRLRRGAQNHKATMDK